MTTTTDNFPGYVAGTWNLDPTHSEVTFSVKHLAISKVRGSFKEFTATLVTAEDPTASTATASIQVASVDTNQKDRDNHLRTSDFFLVEEYPTMDFVSTGIKADGSDFTLYGNLTLRGVTKEITLKGEFGGITTDGYGQTKLGVAATTKINRKDFGVNWNAALEGGGFTLGDDVTINVELQFVLQAA
ncbi:YceI family protein [Lacisediminihabitans changchengi]|uniref:YceI family protein n=1 Tax=Lacisediminihabitans changchengi TaxID=2787634 RepID=A0A934SG75_9MICO|nr:YceI family protein [Lacisediminihabitans changchengi]MBK4346087.1 YceI family protein [Lacisediminihabitans changchengi]